MFPGQKDLIMGIDNVHILKGNQDDSTVFPHKCVADDCERIIQLDDEPWCFEHSPDDGSTLRGYSARAAFERNEPNSFQLKIPAPEGSTFTPTALDNSIGKTAPIYGVGMCRITSVQVIEDGAWALVTLEHSETKL